MAAVAPVVTPEFPALSEMGITRFHEITSYTLRQDGETRDILKVHYERAKGSFLPTSRKYKFGRAEKTVVADGGTARLQRSHEISPFLLKAVAELDSLLGKRDQNIDQKAQLIAEISQLESTLSKRLAELRRQVEAL